MNYFDALSGGGQPDPVAADTGAVSEATGGPIGRRPSEPITNLGLRLFYSDNNDPAFAPRLGTVDRERDRLPDGWRASRSRQPSPRTRQAIQGAWMTYTGTGTTHAGQSIDLTQDPASPASGGHPAVDGLADVPTSDYMAQAVNGVGLVGRDDNLRHVLRRQPAARAFRRPPVNSITGKTYGDANFAVNPTASSGLAVTLSLGHARNLLVGRRTDPPRRRWNLHDRGRPARRRHPSRPRRSNGRSFTIAKDALTITGLGSSQDLWRRGRSRDERRHDIGDPDCPTTTPSLRSCSRAQGPARLRRLHGVRSDQAPERGRRRPAGR